MMADGVVRVYFYLLFKHKFKIAEACQWVDKKMR